jgi:uncharacterized protein YndB with AHSA1/START domain
MATFSQSATIAAPVEKVFEVLSDPALIPKWRTDVPGISEINGGSAVGTTFTEAVNFMGKKSLKMKVTEFEPDRRLTISALDGMSILPTQHFTLTSTPEGTRIQLDVDLKVSGAMKILAPLFPPKFKKIWAGYFENLNTYLSK